MLRATPVIILLAASPAASAPFNTFEAETLQVDSVSGGPPASETARAPDPDVLSEPDTDTETTEPAPKKEVAVLEPAATTEVRDTVLTPPPTHRAPRPTPRFELGAGGFLQSRGLAFDYLAYDLDDGPPAYEDSLQGFAVAAAVYPFPIAKVDGKLSGIGFSVKLATSVGASMVAVDETGFGEYTVKHATYDAAVHYRYPHDKFAIDAEVAYGNWHHTIVDLPESIAVPDTSYQYLSAGLHGDVYPTERASIGATVKYLHVSSSGDVMSEDWYGSGSAHGWVLGGDVVIPLPANLHLRAGVEWRKITLDLEGSGYLAYEWEVWTIEDTALTGSALLGTQF
jgi:hypothetical protein